MGYSRKSRTPRSTRGEDNFIPDPTSKSPFSQAPNKSTRRLLTPEIDSARDHSMRKSRTSPKKLAYDQDRPSRGAEQPPDPSFYDRKANYTPRKVTELDPNPKTRSDNRRNDVTPEKKRKRTTPSNPDILHSVTNLSNSEIRYRNKSQDTPVSKRLVERRNSNYSYDGTKESFLEKIVNNDYLNNLNENPGMEKYLNQCRVQTATAKDLSMYMMTQPFMGVQVDLIPQTNSKNPKLINRKTAPSFGPGRDADPL